MWSNAAAKQQSGIAELIQRGLQLAFIMLCYRFDQFIGKLTAEHRPNLGNRFRRRSKPIQASY